MSDSSWKSIYFGMPITVQQWRFWIKVWIKDSSWDMRSAGSDLCAMELKTGLWMQNNNDSKNKRPARFLYLSLNSNYTECVNLISWYECSCLLTSYLKLKIGNPSNLIDSFLNTFFPTQTFNSHNLHVQNFYALLY